MNLKELSKALSHALRHEPWLYELELDDEGWAPLDAVLRALRKMRPWQELSQVDIDRMLELAEKRRHEIVGDRIRALYGHSIPGKLLRQRAAPPRQLFHGTAPEVMKEIQASGLKPMARQYVHLSIDVATAWAVGKRKSQTPVLLEIAAQSAYESGVAFYAGNDKVWLADLVPSRFLRPVSP